MQNFASYDFEIVRRNMQPVDETKPVPEPKGWMYRLLNFGIEDIL